MKKDKNKIGKIRLLGAAAMMTAILVTGCGASGNNTSQNATSQNSGSNSGNSATAAAISQEEAKQIAFEDAGVQESEASRIKVEEDRDDGRITYDVQFSVAEKEYDYEIDASDGTIISAETETKGGNVAPAQDSGNAGGQNGANVAVSEADAKAAALARVEGATEADLHMELELDDGYYVYEGDIIYQQKEYEFEIDAQTGSFLKWSEERY